jgi:hypothetical protein
VATRTRQRFRASGPGDFDHLVAGPVVSSSPSQISTNMPIW